MICRGDTGISSGALVLHEKKRTNSMGRGREEGREREREGEEKIEPTLSTVSIVYLTNSMINWYTHCTIGSICIVSCHSESVLPAGY